MEMAIFTGIPMSKIATSVSRRSSSFCVLIAIVVLLSSGARGRGINGQHQWLTSRLFSTDSMQILKDLGFHVTTRPDATVSWPSGLGGGAPCSLGELDGTHLLASVNSLDLHTAGSAFLVTGKTTRCDGKFLLLYVYALGSDPAVDLGSGFSKDNRELEPPANIVSKAVAKIRGRDLPRCAIGRGQRSVFFDELDAVSKERVAQRYRFFSAEMPAQVRRALPALQHRVQTVLGGDWVWSRVRQVLDPGSDSNYFGTYQVRGTAGRNGASIAVDPLEGRVTQVFLWSTRQRGCATYP